MELYVAGGIDETRFNARRVEFLDLTNPEAWTTMADLPVAWWGSADLWIDNILFLAGGYWSGDERAGSWWHDMYYDPEADEWTLGPALETPRYRAEGDTIQVGEQITGYVLGGWGDLWDAHGSTEILESCGP